MDATTCGVKIIESRRGARRRQVTHLALIPDDHLLSGATAFVALFSEYRDFRFQRWRLTRRSTFYWVRCASNDLIRPSAGYVRSKGKS